jgi:hypothetical protein
VSVARTLIVTTRDDFLIGRVLRTVALDEFEPLPIDVLRFGEMPPQDKTAIFINGTLPMPAWPCGVREFVVETLDQKVAPTGWSLDDLIQRYARVAVMSIHPGNALIINHLLERHPDKPLSVICNDDEIDRYYLYQQQIAQAPERESYFRSILLYSPEVERAFEGVRRFFLGRNPWEMMLRTGRQNEVELVPWMQPLINKIPRVSTVERRDDIYTVILFLRPSVSLDSVQEFGKRIAAGNRGRPINMVTFRNDLPTLSEIDGISLRCYPYPLNELGYHQVIAQSHGVVMNPRGAISTLRDAVRYRLDLITPIDGVINHIFFSRDIGVTCIPIDALQLEDPDGVGQQRREDNCAAVARYEFGSIAAFRREYCES